jgi:uroporphyrinogen-III synthase
MKDGSPQGLGGKRIVVTRAAHQALAFSRKLEQCGARVLHLPLITITATQEPDCPIDLEIFDWLLLTSANAVHYLDLCLKNTGKSFENLSHCRVAVIGRATQESLASHGVNAEVLPEKHVADALIKALFSAEHHPAGKHVLYPKGSLASHEIECALKIRGMSVTSFICYETLFRPVPPEEIKLLAAFNPDAVTFFSPSAVQSFVTAGLQRIVTVGTRHTVYASIGPVTTKSIQEAGLSPVIESPRQIEDNLIQTLGAYFVRKNYNTIN